MNKAFAGYQAEAQSALSPLSWVAALQQEALTGLETLGFPDRKVEDWRYTSLQPFLAQTFHKQGLQEAAPISQDFPLEPAWCWVNGTCMGKPMSLPEGVIMLPLTEAFTQHADKIVSNLSTYQSQLQGFHALNTAFLEQGLFIYIPAGVRLAEPLLLSHYQNGEQGAMHMRHVLVLEANSEATVITDYAGLEGCSYLTNVVMDVHLHAQAKLTHYSVQRESKQAYHVGLSLVKQEQGSFFASHVLSLGGQLARSDIQIELVGQDATAVLNGVYMPEDKQHIAHHTTVQHRVPHCSSFEDYKGILRDKATAVFNGKVVVSKDAVQTQAKQSNKNLLLSKGAEVYTQPQLDIFADDVLCTHGATVGQLDEEALFYLATRGIDRQAASSYLVKAFVIDNMEQVPHPLIAQWMTALIENSLE